MPGPAKSSILIPARGAVQVNPLMPLVVKASEYVYAGARLDAGWLAPATAIPDTGAGAGVWVDDSYLKTTDRTQAQMASAGALGVSNALTFAGFTWGSLIAADEVHGLYLRTYATAAFTAGFPGAGDTAVRHVVSHAATNEIIAEHDALYLEPWAGGSAPQRISSQLDLSPWMRKNIARQSSVAELEALVAGLRIQIFPVAGEEHFVTTWYCGAPDLVVQRIYGHVPKIAHRVEVYRDAGLTDLEYASSTVESTGPYMSIPTRSMSGGGERWIRHQDQDEASIVSTWSDPVKFTLMSDAAAAMIVDDSSGATVLLGIEPYVFATTPRWSLTSAATWQAAIDRSSLPVDGMQILDIEIGGVRQNAAIVDDAAEVEATSNSIAWDGSTCWVQTTEAHLPAASGGNGSSKAGGIRVVFVFPCATSSVRSGRYESLQYLSIIEPGSVKLEQQLTDVGLAGPPEASGSLQLANDVLRETQTGESERHAWRRTQTTRPNPGTGVIWSGAPVRLSLLGDGMAYRDRLRLGEGRLDARASSINSGKMSFDLRGLPSIAEQVLVGDEIISRSLWPAAPDGSIGKTIPVAFGSPHVDVPVHEVSEPLPGTIWFQGPRGFGAVRGLRLNGALQPPLVEWSYDSVRSLVSIFGSLAPRYRNGEVVTIDVDGVPLVDYRGVTTSTVLAGGLFRELFRRMGLSTSLNTSRFEQMDDQTAGGERVPVRALIDRPASIQHMLTVLGRTRAVYVVPRSDGSYDWAPYIATDIDANTVWIDESDIPGGREAVSWSQDVKHMASLAAFTCRPLVELAGLDVARKQFRETTDVWGIAREVELETYHHTKLDAHAFLDRFEFDRPRNLVTFPAGRRTVAVPVGGTIALSLPEAHSERGFYRRDLLQLLGRTLDDAEQQQLVCAWRGRIPAEAWP